MCGRGGDEQGKKHNGPFFFFSSRSSVNTVPHGGQVKLVGRELALELGAELCADILDTARSLLS